MADNADNSPLLGANRRTARNPGQRTRIPPGSDFAVQGTRPFLVVNRLWAPTVCRLTVIQGRPGVAEIGGLKADFSGFSANVPILDKPTVAECKPESPDKKNP